MTENKGGGGNTIPVVGIIAVVGLLVFFAWFFMGRDANAPVSAAPQAQTDSGNDVHIKVDLPDSVVIKP
jgi:hypothetical protein